MFARFVRWHSRYTGDGFGFYLLNGRVRVGGYVPELRQYGAEIHRKGASVIYFALWSRRRGEARAKSPWNVGRMDWGSPQKRTYLTFAFGRVHVDVRPAGIDWEREFSMVEVFEDRIWPKGREVKML